MPSLTVIWLILVSLVAGSFFGVVVARIDEPASILTGRSHCDGCRRSLGARDLIPLVSWLVVRGRCRTCGMRLGLFYPLFELGAVAVAAWSVALATGWLVWVTALLGWVLLTLAVIDARHMFLPDFLTLPLVAAGLAVSAASDRQQLVSSAIGAAAGFLFVAMIRAAYRRFRGVEAIGLGDAKLLAAAGAWLGWQGLPSTILLASLTGLAVVSFRLMRGAEFSLGDPVPFGTYLCIGIWVVWLYGPLG